MSMTAAHHYFRDKHCDYQAEQASMEALLNCYCRDIAQPAAELSIQTGPGSQPWPQALRTRLTLEAANVLEIALPGSEDILLVLVAGDSPTCNYRYLSAPFYKSALRGWQILGLEQLARLLLNSMAERFHQPINSELYRQILLSREVMGTVLAYSQVPNDWGQGTEAFRWSEQSLSFGHRYHPAPKSRKALIPRTSCSTHRKWARALPCTISPSIQTIFAPEAKSPMPLTRTAPIPIWTYRTG